MDLAAISIDKLLEIVRAHAAQCYSDVSVGDPSFFAEAFLVLDSRLTTGESPRPWTQLSETEAETLWSLLVDTRDPDIAEKRKPLVEKLRRMMTKCTTMTCAICLQPIKDGIMLGVGDGAGQKFAHRECYHANRGRSSTFYARSGRREVMRICEGVAYLPYVVRFSTTDGKRRRVTLWSPGHPWLDSEVRSYLIARNDVDLKRAVRVERRP